MITEEFKPITFDINFKYLFSNKIILEDFINTFFKFINSYERFLFTDIEPEACMLPNNKTLSIYFGDIVATSNSHDFISLEMYKDKFDKESFNKSFAYTCRLYDESIINNDYKNAKKVYSINLMNGNFRRCNNDLVNDYQFINIKNNKQIDNGSIEIFLIRLDKIVNLPYNEHEDRFITYLRIINAKSLSELRKYIRKDDKVMTYAEQIVSDWCRESSKNGFERYLADVKNEGISQGISQGIKKGISEGILTTAKNMLIDNVNTDTITKYTGLSKNELLKLKKELN